MADQWEYMSLTLKWDVKTNQWQTISSSGEALRGTEIGAALNPEGEQGWEVVNFIPRGGWSRVEVVENVRNTLAYDTTSYLVLFKRRKP